MSLRSRIGWSIVGAIALAFIFQVFFRYQFMMQPNGEVHRIDRLLGEECEMPCTPATPSESPSIVWDTPSPKLTQEQWNTAFDNLEAQRIQLAIEIAKVSGPAGRFAPENGLWRNLDPDPFAKASYPKPVDEAVPTTFLICYCDSNENGWYFEVHTDSHNAYYVNDNAELLKKYRVDRAKVKQ